MYVALYIIRIQSVHKFYYMQYGQKIKRQPWSDQWGKEMMVIVSHNGNNNNGHCRHTSITSNNDSTTNLQQTQIFYEIQNYSYVMTQSESY